MNQPLAVIDIGTVTCRLFIARLDEGKLLSLAKRYAIVNLGEGVDKTRILSPAALDRLSHLLKDYLDLTKEYEVQKIIVFATSAARDAENRQEFLDLLQSYGLKPQILTGNEEAEYAFRGATLDFPRELVLVADVGGGSTEIAIGKASQKPSWSYSFDIGCRRVTERFFRCDPPSPNEIERARQWIKAEFEKQFSSISSLLEEVDRIVAVAGAATSVVTLRDQLKTYDPTLVHKATVSFEDLQDQFDYLGSLTLEQRKAAMGLDPKRAPVILAGLLILQVILEVTGKPSYSASDTDILEGIILAQEN